MNGSQSLVNAIRIARECADTLLAEGKTAEASKLATRVLNAAGVQICTADADALEVISQLG